MGWSESRGRLSETLQRSVRDGGFVAIHSMIIEHPPLGLGEIGQLGVTITDLDQAVAFYRDVLGLKHLFNAPPSMAFFACGQIRLMLSRVEKPEAERFSAAIYFTVEDIHSANQNLVRRGVVFEAEPRLLAKMPDHELWMAFFRDPDKNLLALMCEKRA